MTMPQIAHKLGVRDEVDVESDESVDEEWDKLWKSAIEESIRYFRVLPYELLILEPKYVGDTAKDFLEIPIGPEKLRRRVVNAKRLPVHLGMVRSSVIEYLKGIAA